MREIDKPGHFETLSAYLYRMEITHFSVEEILTLRRAGLKAPEPPREIWHRIIPTLRLAEELRDIVGPLIVGNGYRPKDLNKRVGGSRTSRHIHFQALDLDLVERTSVNQELFYEAACEIYLNRGADLKMGIGLYRPWRGNRVHIDTGHRRRYWHKEYVKPLLMALR